MAWQDEMVLMVRYLINDVDSPYTNTDAKLEKLITVAAQQTLNDIEFKQTYTVDISTPDITPDPTDGDKDNAFINLVSLKAACLYDNWSFRSKLGVAGISVRSGADSVSTNGQLSGYQWILQNGPCKAFEQAKWEFEAGNLTPGRAILGPFAGWNIDTDGPSENRGRS